MKNHLIVCAIIFLMFETSYATIWTVRPNSKYKYCSEIANIVQDNDTILIENGIYTNDFQVTWKKNNLLIKGINGKPELIAGEKIAKDNDNGKGIFVIQGNNTIVENITFKNSKVPDNNGAGIRQEGKNLNVRNCEFIGNEMGILQGGTIKDCSIIIEFCKFENNGSSDNPGYQHNIYINHIDSLIFRFNSTINATASGHELKSRANYNFIEYNRISNISTVDSRNIDIPNGGTTIILGNIIEQGENSENSNLIGYGMEGAINSTPHNLFIINNTIVNYKDKGNFLSLKDNDSLMLKNNICVGAKTGGFITGNYNFIDSSNNFINDNIESAKFKIKTIIDYELESESPAVNSGCEVKKLVNSHFLTPEYEYLIDIGIKKREIDKIIDIGARELNLNTNVEEYFKLNILPNPASEYIEISLDRWTPSARWSPSVDEGIKIYNIFGECVINYELQITNYENARINISQLLVGLYLIKIGNFTQKFMVVR